MRQTFLMPKRFNKKRKKLILDINDIISSYYDKGMRISVRQCYYQCVSKGLIDNNAKQYNNIVNLVADGRMWGLIDWDMIEDRTRYLRENNHWENPEEIIKDAVSWYQIDTRTTQPNYIEAWCEKDSLISILEATCNRLDVPCFSCRGNPSITALYEAAARFAEHEQQGQHCIVLYAGDHDPSGLNIPAVIQERFADFHTDVELIRIGITLDQIRALNLPPFPAKEKDKNIKKYIAQTGLKDAWELDALPPETLSDLFESHILALTDKDLWVKEIQREKQDKVRLAGMFE